MVINYDTLTQEKKNLIIDAVSLQRYILENIFIEYECWRLHITPEEFWKKNLWDKININPLFEDE